VFSILN